MSGVPCVTGGVTEKYLLIFGLLSLCSCLKGAFVVFRFSCPFLSLLVIFSEFIYLVHQALVFRDINVLIVHSKMGDDGGSIYFCTTDSLLARHAAHYLFLFTGYFVPGT